MALSWVMVQPQENAGKRGWCSIRWVNAREDSIIRRFEAHRVRQLERSTGFALSFRAGSVIKRSTRPGRAVPGGSVLKKNETQLGCSSAAWALLLIPIEKMCHCVTSSVHRIVPNDVSPNFGGRRDLKCEQTLRCGQDSPPPSLKT
jgi:hypothetical protein